VFSVWCSNSKIKIKNKRRKEEKASTKKKKERKPEKHRQDKRHTIIPQGWARSFLEQKDVDRLGLGV